MNTLLVGYDLNKPAQNYAGLIEALKSHGTWWHHLDSTWFIRTTRTPSQLRDELMELIDANDELLVMNVSGDVWATSGLPQRANDWLRENA
ncbi:MAG TPA: hypothetical protein VIL92_00160 [Gaiellaceae bacterium]|jgi:hypothetical protein